jgi:hypothetical protein
VRGSVALPSTRCRRSSHFLTWPAFGDLTEEILGVKARRVPFPKPVIYAVGSLLDLLRRIAPVAYPLRWLVDAGHLLGDAAGTFRGKLRS